MNDVAAPDDIPEDFMRRKGALFRNASLRDRPKASILRPEELKAVEADMAYLEKTVLPLIRNARKERP
jgi:hypothetical protein